MSMEAAVVVDVGGRAIRWHLPPGRTGGSLPDSRELWEFIWENRQRISGIAHSHPGRGVPGPSYTDVTTFEAIESALGRRLLWWITSEDRMVTVRWEGSDKLSYRALEVPRLEGEPEPEWLVPLREASYRALQERLELAVAEVLELRQEVLDHVRLGRDAVQENVRLIKKRVPYADDGVVEKAILDVLMTLVMKHGTGGT